MNRFLDKSDQSRQADSRIFQVGTGWFPEQKGGLESAFYNLYRSLGGFGFNVTGLVAGNGQAEQDTAGAIRSFPVEGRPVHRRLLDVRKIARESFATNPPDVVTSHFAFYSMPLLLDCLGRLPLVVHFHGPWALESKAEGASALSVTAKKLIERLTYNRAERIIVLSKAFAHILQNEYGIAESKFRMTTGGIDCRLFDVPLSKQSARHALGWEPDRLILFTARRLVRRMGLDKLIAALNIVRQQPNGKEVVLHIAGAGPERSALQKQLDDLNLTNVVFLDGRVSDEALRLSYRAADLTVVPTADLEGFGLVAVESLAAGTPVLVTPIGGLPEVVSGLSLNMILAGANAASIADGIINVVKNPALLPNSEACQRYAFEKYDWSVVIPQIAAVYREVL